MQVCEPVNFLVSPWFWYRRCHQANSPVFVFVCFSYHGSSSSSFCGCSHLLLCLSVALVAFVVIVVACYACAVAVAATVVAVLLLLLLLVGLAFLLLFLQLTEAGLYATISTAGHCDAFGLVNDATTHSNLRDSMERDGDPCDWYI